MFNSLRRIFDRSHVPAHPWPPAPPLSPVKKIRAGYDDPIAKAMLKILGCPKNVRRLEYHAEVGEASTVTVEYLPGIADNAGEVLEPILKTFELKEITWPHPPLPSHDGQTRTDLDEAQQRLVREGRAL